MEGGGLHHLLHIKKLRCKKFRICIKSHFAGNRGTRGKPPPSTSTPGNILTLQYGSLASLKLKVSGQQPLVYQIMLLLNLHSKWWL